MSNLGNRESGTVLNPFNIWFYFILNTSNLLEFTIKCDLIYLNCITLSVRKRQIALREFPCLCSKEKNALFSGLKWGNYEEIIDNFFIFHVHRCKKSPLTNKCLVDMTCFPKNLYKNLINQATILNSLFSLTGDVAREVTCSHHKHPNDRSTKRKICYTSPPFFALATTKKGSGICSAK